MVQASNLAQFFLLGWPGGGHTIYLPLHADLVVVLHLADSRVGVPCVRVLRAVRITIGTRTSFCAIPVHPL